MEVNGISLYVEDHGEGVPVLMIHGWPDSARLWRHQVPHLVGRGYRVITPDLRGFGRSGRPEDVAAYRLRNSVADMTAILDQLGIASAHVVGHDWGAAVAWFTAILNPDRVRTLTVISVAHPRATPTVRSYEMAWYQLFFQFPGVAEATVAHDDWAWLRLFSRGDGDQAQWIADLSRPGALTATLNWYRANLAPRRPAPPPKLPPVTVPTMGVWSTGDHYLDGEMMRNSASQVAGPWRYEEIPGASHWVPLDAPGRLNELLVSWLRLSVGRRATQRVRAGNGKGQRRAVQHQRPACAAESDGLALAVVHQRLDLSGEDRRVDALQLIPDMSRGRPGRGRQIEAAGTRQRRRYKHGRRGEDRHVGGPGREHQDAPDGIPGQHR